MSDEEKIQLNSTSHIIKIKLPKELQLDEKGFEKLWRLHPKEHGTVTIFGKQHDVPRYQKAFGHDYHFSGETHKSDEIKNKFLKILVDHVNNEEKHEYNGTLVNWYEDGNHYIGAHSDDESELVKNSPIYSFSFGATRDFVLKHKQTKQRVVIPLENNTLLIMAGETQRYYKHSVPKRLKCKKRRINVTIRAFRA